MTAANFRRIALSMPEAVEGSHFGQADFRVGGKIFATLALESEGYGVLLLTPEQQAGMVEDEPNIFSPVPGGWGRKGATRVRRLPVCPAPPWLSVADGMATQGAKASTADRISDLSSRRYGFAGSTAASVPDLLKPKRRIQILASWPFP